MFLKTTLFLIVLLKQKGNSGQSPFSIYIFICKHLINYFYLYLFKISMKKKKKRKIEKLKKELVNARKHGLKLYIKRRVICAFQMFPSIYLCLKRIVCQFGIQFYLIVLYTTKWSIFWLLNIQFHK